MLRFGVDYYPEHWPEQRWAQDARAMQEAGFNTVRLAEFAWSRMEPAPGQFDFAWLDRAVACLHAHGLDIVLGTPTASPPPWVMAMYPDAYRVLSSGLTQTYGNRRETCPTHPGYRERSRIITAAMASHFAANPAVIGWQTDNEFGDRCHCPHCRRAFQNWLRHKFGSLDALNDAWGTVFWSHEYTEWAQIPVPMATTGLTEFGSPNPGLGLDYLRFMSDAYVAFQHEQVAILRQTCPHHFITHNLMGFGYDKLDYFDLADDLDFVTWDNYRRTQWHMAADVDPTDAALAHATMRGLKQRNFWVMEQQAGSGGWEYVSVAPRPGELRLWAYQAIAHGADAIIFFRWRSARYGIEQYWHGLLDHDGRLSRRYHEVKQMGAELRQIGAQIDGSAVHAEVALILSYDARFAFQIQGANPDFSYARHLRDIYRAFHQRGIAVDIVAPDHDLSAYKLVIAPALHVLPPAHAAALQAYVEQGGVLVVTPRSGVKDEANAVVELPLPGLLAELCGVRVDEYDSLPAGVNQPLAFTPRAARPIGPADACIWCDVLQPTTAEIIATYTADYYAGRPAITLNRAGKGYALYVGTFGAAELYATLAPWLLNLARLDHPSLLPAGVESCVRSRDGVRLRFLLNHTDSPQQVHLPAPAVDLLTGESLGNAPIELAPYAVRILIET